MAAGGLASLKRGWLVPVAGVALVESLAFSGSVAQPSSSTAIPDVYAAIPTDGPVLDLPGSVGATMATSRYWNQTAHRRGIPYSPNVRLDSARDLEVQSAFTDPYLRESEHRVVNTRPRARILKSTAKRYSAIVLTRSQERANLKSAYGPVLIWSLVRLPSTVRFRCGC